MKFVLLGSLINFVFLLLFSVFWRTFVGQRKSGHVSGRRASFLSEKRAAHSDLSLVSIGLIGFFVFTVLLVDVKRTNPDLDFDWSESLYLIGFLLTGFVCYLYFVRGSKTDG